MELNLVSMEQDRRTPSGLSHETVNLGVTPIAWLLAHRVRPRLLSY